MIKRFVEKSRKEAGPIMQDVSVTTVFYLAYLPDQAAHRLYRHIRFHGFV
jgi:hypothetical protein